MVPISCHQENLRDPDVGSVLSLLGPGTWQLL